MILFDAAFQATVGATAVCAARERLAAAARPLDSLAFRDGLLYSALVYIPSAVLFLWAWPGWNSMYLVDLETGRLAGAWWLWFDMVFLFGCYTAGFLASAHLLRRGLRAVLIAFAGLWVLVLGALGLPLWGRSVAVTTYADFHQGTWPRFDLRWGQPDSFFGTTIMFYLLAWGLVAFAGLWLLYRAGRRRAAAA